MRRSLPLQMVAMIGVLVPLARYSFAEEPLSFERDARPIFKAYCLDCHGGAEDLKGGLDLRLKRFAVRGGDAGSAIEPGDPESSYLVFRLRDGEMPPGEKKVPPEEIAIIERWIAEGALTLRDEPEELPPGIDITPEERAFWAFQPIDRPEPPSFAPEDRIRTAIDAFVLAKLREHGLSFAEDADRLTLIRRASIDLSGLPPSSEAIQVFLNDPAPDAYEQMIERLLASPSYGERWARHWLDVAGYADSEGNGNTDTPRPYAYKYRDAVIRSFNADKPLDQFVIEQLAGDELLPDQRTNLTSDQIETLAATGFLRMAIDGTATGGKDPAAANQVVADTIKIVSTTFLGLSVGCAQCHDHRYDPIPQVDYYRFRAVFEPALDPEHWRTPPQRLLSLYSDDERAQAAAIEAEARALQEKVNTQTQEFIASAFSKELQKFPEDQHARLREAYETPAGERSEAQKQLLAANPSLSINAGNLYQYNPKAADTLKEARAEVAAKRAQKPAEDFVRLLSEVPGTVPTTEVFHRGDYRQPTTAVLPGDLTIASPDGSRFEITENDPDLPTTGRRLAYARHLVNGKHPLVGRVLANRIWLNHFGRGLVNTPGDFGVLGERPTHPELLDWLADELVRMGWSLKQMHRLIMTSTVYRQSSRHNPSHDAVDSLNTLYGRFPVLRHDAESLRDSILSVSGDLDLRPFGPPVSVTEDSVGQVLPEGNSTRRSIYLQVRRSKPVSFLDAFDAPVMAVNCERRNLTTSAPQSLVLMNSSFLRERAAALAERLMEETPAGFADELSPSAHWTSGTESDASAETSWPDWIAYAWSLVYQRAITPEELDLAWSFVTAQQETLGTDLEQSTREHAVLTNLCQQLLSSNEFLYVD